MRYVVTALIALTLPARAEVGFFSPQGVFDEFSTSVDFAMFNANSPDQVRENLQRAEEAGLRVHVDLGPVMASSAAPSSLKTDYVDETGASRQKLFEPLERSKIKVIPDDEALRSLLDPYINAMAPHSDALDAIFLIDEPYLNGVSKDELERAGRIIREMASERGFSPRLGVLFASAMFNREFAERTDAVAQEWVGRFDDYRMQIEGTEEGDQWIAAVSESRLTTYDSAGNMTTSGGIPSGFDIVTFDFYTSTLLFDALHEGTLDWYAANTDVESCQEFRGTTSTMLKDELSFFNDGPVQTTDVEIAADAKLLQAVFDCKMDATFALLEAEIAHHDNPQIEIMMIAESSNNGLLEFDANGIVEAGQPEMLVELRVLQEVNRSIEYYEKNKEAIDGGLMFFTYQDEFDRSINLAVGGASKMPSVMDAITNASGR